MFAISEAVGGENGDFLSKYQTMLEEQLEVEKAKLRLQLEEEHSEKLRSLESSWRATLEENEQLVANSTLTQQDATGIIDELNESNLCTFFDIHNIRNKNKSKNVT